MCRAIAATYPHLSAASKHGNRAVVRSITLAVKKLPQKDGPLDSPSERGKKPSNLLDPESCLFAACADARNSGVEVVKGGCQGDELVVRVIEFSRE